jgi:hypothetical protein
LDNPRLLSQFRQFERRTGTAKDVIDHPRGGHDDLCNSVAGALVLASPRRIEITKEMFNAYLPDAYDRALAWQAFESKQNANPGRWWGEGGAGLSS